MENDDFRKMHVWQSAFDLIIEIYRITKDFPSDEKFGIVSDMRRAANSIAHNIAEGYGRYEPKDKNRFYKISRGSCYELISQALVSKELDYISDKKVCESLIKMSKEIIKELNSIMKTLDSNI
ncbi:MAG: four helix bundle protein [Ignavibacteria bacterium]|nr:four helix bundle protein [Ignavibacteria bacterium]